MKQKQYQLEGPWGDLFSTSVDCVGKLLPGCDRLDRLVRTVNGIARATEALNAGCLSLLDDCRETFLWLIPRCGKVEHLVSATRCIARVMRRFGVDWSSLLDACRCRLMQLVPECEDLAAAVRVVDCIVAIAPLVAVEENEATTSDEDSSSDLYPEADTSVATGTRIIEIPWHPLQPPALAREQGNTSRLPCTDRP